jgi:hypothetical protein
LNFSVESYLSLYFFDLALGTFLFACAFAALHAPPKSNYNMQQKRGKTASKVPWKKEKKEAGE